METNKIQWRRIAKGEELPCDALLMRNDGTIPPKVGSNAGVIVAKDAYYLPIEELRNLPKEESKDERIRKELIEFVKSRGGFKQEYIAWLETQGAHKKFRDSIQIGDEVTRNEDGVLINLSQLKRVAKPTEVQGEHKYIPKYKIGDYVKNTNYKGEPIYEIVYMDKECYICEYRGKEKMGDKAVIHFSFDNPYLRLVQKPTEVEPKFKVGDKVKSIIDGFECTIESIDNTCYYGDTTNFDIQDQDGWELVEPKPWSDEDYNEIESIACHLDNTDNEDMADALRSIRDKYYPQTIWKPTNEQIHALNYVVNLMASSESPKENDYFYNLFKDLKEQLLKLYNYDENR